MSKRINTCDEFDAALNRVPFARDRLLGLRWRTTSNELPLRAYGWWNVLLDLVHAAIAEQDWPSVGELLKLYDSVRLAGKHGEMFEASYVAFLEEVQLPHEPANLRKFWQVCPRQFLKDIERDRRIRRAK